MDSIKNNDFNKNPNLQPESLGSTDANLTDNHTLELLEERPMVQKESIVEGKVKLTKHIRTRTVNVPIELTEEVLQVEVIHDDNSKRVLTNSMDDDNVITHLEPMLAATPEITINGKPIAIGHDPFEVVLTRETATIQKQTFAVEEVCLTKKHHTHRESIDVELKHEELDIHETDNLTQLEGSLPSKK